MESRTSSTKQITCYQHGSCNSLKRHTIIKHYIIACMLSCYPAVNYKYLMQVPSILHRADQIISAMHHCGWDVPYLLQVVHDPAIMVKPSTVDKEMAAGSNWVDVHT